MQLPPVSSTYTARVRFGHYVLRRLRREKLGELAVECERVTSNVRACGRACEDAEVVVQEAFADRDAADDGLDDTAQLTRHALASRSLDATRKAPYTLIFPEGVSYYIDAGVTEEVARYTELKTRIADQLPEGDAVRRETVTKLDQGVAEYRSAEGALTQAQTDASLAGTRLDAATAEWARSMERVYGALIHQFGKTAAERFFPRPSRSSKAKKSKKAAPHSTPPDA